MLHRFLERASVHQVARALKISRCSTRNPYEDKTENKLHLCSRYAVQLIFLMVALTPLEAPADTLTKSLSETDYIEFDTRQAKLGQLLFYDKILSGNRNISCGTCHHHSLGGSDGLSLGIGEGGEGIGVHRSTGADADKIRRRIPRNAPGLWNLGAKSISVLFHDGRLSRSDDYGNGFNSPAEEWLPHGLNSLLAAQALFPVASRFEMAGDPEENSIARASFDRIDHVWPIISKRVRAIPEYETLFLEAFTEVRSVADISIVEIGNALAAFIGTEWRSMDSPFDEYQNGNKNALNTTEKRGMALFLNKAECHSCHAGALFTDQKFHALALPPFGPGKIRANEVIARDVGRMGESDRLEDAYRFRTPSLRNAELTAPYGHNGAYKTLAAIIKHHTDPIKALNNWVPDFAILPEIESLQKTDFIVWQDSREMQRYQSKVDINIPALSDNEINDLVAFIKALTGRTATKTPLGRPNSVPSGLHVDGPPK